VFEHALTVVSSAVTPGVERHRAPALWLVGGAILTACAAALLQGSRAAALVVAATLVLAAVARLVRRGRLPEGIAVRSTVADVLVLLSLAAAILVLQSAPGI
jgi:hypothetical protein